MKLIAASLLAASMAFSLNAEKNIEPTAYLFTYFTGNSIADESVHYAVSNDGFNFTALNDNKPVIDSKVISSTGGVRDPHILRGPDGKTFYMVLTDMVSAKGWDSNRAMILMKSNDLINWTSNVINIQDRFAGNEDLKRVWAPQSIYDPEAGKMLVYWSMKHGDGPDIIYYAYANDDFTDLEGEPKPFFIPKDGKSCIDGDIMVKDGVYHMFYKTEGHGNGIKTATTKSLSSGKWVEDPEYKQQTRSAVEGAGTFKLINSDKYILMYDVYIDGKYQFTESTDLVNFKPVEQEVKMNFHPRHGTIMPITQEEYERLLNAWPITHSNLNVATNKIGAKIHPTMYGLFFEDINYAADGGLYAEKVKNRSFEFPQNLMGWKTFGNIDLKDDGPFERNPHYVRLGAASHGHKHTGLENEGFFGIGVEADKEYRFSVWARTPEGGKANIRVALVQPASQGENQDITSQNLSIDSKEWKKYSVILKSSVTDPKAILRIFLSKPETTVDLEHISLFPVDTWKGHENGLRRDLVEKLYDIKPGLLRFPGGCIVEGTEITDRYQWKNTVGPVENRPLNFNRWHYTFPHRFYPDYFQSYGLGFYEYFLLAEELGAAPLPVLNVGLACQYQNDSEDAHVPVDALQPYIDDAIDLIEFANGDTSTKWGALRAEMGHPEPFGLKYLAIGNEQWGNEYVERLKPFVDALRKSHPEIMIVGSSGPQSEGREFDFLWPEMRKVKADLVDEHFYRPAQWFLSQGNRYDNYDRKGPAVFAGEYACHINGKKYNHFYPALLEAAFMTGLERNADIVHMATYAPLFAHVEGWQWRPDLIWFDNLSSFPTSSYHVQKLYGNNRGSRVVPITLDDNRPAAGNEGQNGLFASAVIDDDTNEFIVKVANTSDKPHAITIDFDKLKKNESISGGNAITLTAPSLDAENSIERPDLVKPVTSAINVAGKSYSTILAPYSFTVYRFKRSSK